MLQILHIPGIQYAGETREQSEERDRRTVESNERLRQNYEHGEKQRITPMKCMQQWASDRGIPGENVLEQATRERAEIDQTASTGSPASPCSASLFDLEGREA